MWRMLGVVFCAFVFTAVLPAVPIVTVELSGEVSTPLVFPGLLTGVDFGDPVDITFSYRLMVPDTDPGDSTGAYQGSPVSGTASIGPHQLFFSAPSEDSGVFFFNFPGFPGFIASALFDSATFVAGPNEGVSVAFPPFLFAFGFFATSSGVLTSDDLIPVPVEGWDMGSGAFRVVGVQVNYIIDVESIRTTVTQPIPEPGTLTLCLTGILWLVWTQRKWLRKPV